MFWFVGRCDATRSRALAIRAASLHLRQRESGRDGGGDARVRKNSVNIQLGEIDEVSRTQVIVVPNDDNASTTHDAQPLEHHRQIRIIIRPVASLTSRRDHHDRARDQWSETTVGDGRPIVRIGTVTEGLSREGTHHFYG